MTSFANITRTTASYKWIYILGKISNDQELGPYVKNKFLLWMNEKVA